MITKMAALGLLMFFGLQAQQIRKDPVFTSDVEHSSKEACKALDVLAEKVQAQHPSLKISAECGLVYGSREESKLPEKHIPITRQEAMTLKILRGNFTAAADAQSAYEKYLMAAHGVPEVPIESPCYHFRGFVLDNDYITDDPNSFDPLCNSKEKH